MVFFCRGVICRMSRRSVVVRGNRIFTVKVGGFLVYIYVFV